MADSDFMEKKDGVVVERRENLALEQTLSDGSGDKALTDELTHIGTEENKLTFGFFMTMVGFSMTFIVAEVTPLIMITSFSVISYDLGAIEKVIWVIVTPYITTGAIVPFVGNISDLIGRRGVVLLSMVLSVVGFAISGAAPGFGVFLFGQGLLGMAIGVQVLTVISAASELVPARKRGSVLAYLVCGFIPFLPAPVYGQLLVEINWRYIFAFLGAWAFIAGIVLAIFYHPPPRPNSAGLTTKQMLGRIDYIGGFLMIAAIVLFLVGINWGGQEYPWTSYKVLLPILLGIALFVAFGLYEYFLAKYPMFPGRIVQNKRLFAGVSVLCLTSGINFVPITVFWTLQTYAVYRDGFRMAGVHLLPVGFCIVGGAFMAAILISVAKKHIMWVLLGFCAMQTIGIGCMSLADPNDINTMWAPLIFGLFGVGGVLLPSQVVFSAISPDDLIGTSVALSLIIRMLGQVVGKAMFYNIFKKELTKKAPAIIGLAAIQAGFSGPDLVQRITDFITTMTAGPMTHYAAAFPEIKTPEALDMVVTAGNKLFAAVFPGLYHISIPFGAFATVSCLLLWGVDKYMDDRVAVHLGH